MMDITAIGDNLYRVWLVRVAGWAPRHWDASPLLPTALEPLEGALLTATESYDYLRAVNERLLRSRDLWSVRVPVRLRIEGDLEAGRSYHRIGAAGHERWLRQCESEDFSEFSELRRAKCVGF